MKQWIKKIRYYFWSTYRRRTLDALLKTNASYYGGVVIDIGGRDRGKFEKPKKEVDQWIFADISPEHHPDIQLDVANMHNVTDGSVDVINALELFEHVEYPEKGLSECYRVLKKGGVLFLSVPFLYPIHADPFDFQRWTEDKWRNEFTRVGFTIEKGYVMGRDFTVLCEQYKMLVKVLPFIIRAPLYVLYPLYDLIVLIDRFRWVKDHPRLGKCHGGYLWICRK